MRQTASGESLGSSADVPAIPQSSSWQSEPEQAESAFYQPQSPSTSPLPSPSPSPVSTPSGSRIEPPLPHSAVKRVLALWNFEGGANSQLTKKQKKQRRASSLHPGQPGDLPLKVGDVVTLIQVHALRRIDSFSSCR